MTTTQSKELTRKQAATRFVVFGVLGICIFFVKFSIGGKMTIPIDWLCSLIAVTLLGSYYNQVCAIGATIMVYFMIKRKAWKTDPAVTKFFDCLGILSFVCLVLNVFGAAPALVTQNNILGGGISTLGKGFLQILVIMFFLPLLINYGLPEAFGVFLRPVCRFLWNVPGRVAVIIVSAFLGNFTVGHMEANMYYTDGKVTLREAAIMATGFATPSLAIFFIFTSLAKQTDRLPLVMGVCFVLVLIITAIVSHIPPLSKYPQTYYEGCKPQPEDYEKGNLFKVAWNTGVDICKQSPELLPSMGKIGIGSVPMVSNVCFIGIGSIVFFGLINLYTPIFKFIGYLFYPLLQLFGMQAEIIAPNMGLGLVSTLAAQTAVITAKGANQQTIFFGMMFVVTIMVFFGSFLASLYSTKIKVKLLDFFFIWLERAYLTIILLSLASKMFA
jgi:nucleoside recognition membrane protein YjiH